MRQGKLGVSDWVQVLKTGRAAACVVNQAVKEANIMTRLSWLLKAAVLCTALLVLSGKQPRNRNRFCVQH